MLREGWSFKINIANGLEHRVCVNFMDILIDLMGQFLIRI